MRPFGKTDIDFITSGRFAQLENATKAVYHVITGIVSFRTGQFFHSAATIADLAGYSVGSAERALHELLEQKVISVVLQRPGLTTLYSYNFVADGADRGGYSTIDPRPIPDAAQPPPSPTMEPSLVHEGGRPSHMRDEQDLFNEIRTTTAADRISSSLIQRLISKYGENRVKPVVVAMKSMNGEVLDADAYFCSAVTRGYIPTSKKAKQAEKVAARKEAARKRREEEKQEYQKRTAEFKRETQNPEIQARIQAEIEKANRLLGIQE